MSDEDRKAKLAKIGIPFGDSGELHTKDNEPENKTKKKVLSAVFNVAAGFGAAAAAKAAVTTFTVWAGWPVIGTVLISSLAVGAAVTAVHHVMDNKKAEEEGVVGTDFWSEENAKKFAVSSLFALAGGALFLQFDGVLDKLGDLFSPSEPTIMTPINLDVHTTNVIPIDNIVTPEEIITIEPTIEPVVVTAISCGDMAESFKDWAGGSVLSEKVMASIASAENGNPQGVKDLGYFLFNGFGGVAENQELAVEMFKCAAADGNIQAQVDSAYTLFHGLGQSADKQVAIDAMKEIKGSVRAEWFVEQWSNITNTSAMADIPKPIQTASLSM